MTKSDPMKVKGLLSALLCFCLLLSLTALGEEAAPESLPADNLIDTRHSVMIEGKQVDYTATAGTMLMDTAQGQCEVFYVAYTADQAEDSAKRPITFAFNGGPGCASVWLHLGLLGPERVALSEDGMVERVPARTVANEYSILDMTDLVIIDPVGTGFSRALPGTDESVYYNLKGDNASVGDFIGQYVRRHDRWASPKYIIGESYGTVRAVGVCDYLLNTYHMNLNGMILISSANDFGAFVSSVGNDLPYVNLLPTFAAAAQYHKRVDEKYQAMPLEDYLDEVKDFAAGEYQLALYQGSRLDADEQDAVAQRLSDYIGLDKDFILERNLRVSTGDFCAALLGDQKLTVGRFDSRYTGPVLEGSLEDGTSDPSSVGLTEAFISAFNDYVVQALGYRTDRLYIETNFAVDEQWSYDSDGAAFAQEDLIRNCMSANPFLKIWVIGGYYDLATPFFSAEWIFSHVFLNDALKENLSFSRFPTGHMFYLSEPALRQFRADAKAWYGVE